MTLHTLKAVYRFVIFWLLRWTPIISYDMYKDPVLVGYRGYWNLASWRGSMCLVFHRLDGTRQYRW